MYNEDDGSCAALWCQGDIDENGQRYTPSGGAETVGCSVHKRAVVANDWVIDGLDSRFFQKPALCTVCPIQVYKP